MTARQTSSGPPRGAPTLRLHAALLALAMLAPLASAGTEDDPEIDDGRDQREAWKDILSVWLEDHPDGVKFTIKVASLQSPRPGVLYTLAWNTRSDVAIGFDGTRALRSSVDTPNGWTGEGQGPGRLDNALLAESFTPGSPAYLSAVIPSARFGFEDGDVLRNLFSRTVYYDASTGEWVLESEIASGRRPFELGADQLFPILVPAWMLPTIVLVCTVAGAGAGFALARRRKRAPVSAAPRAPAVATRAPPPPPGQRFQRGPPPR